MLKIPQSIIFAVIALNISGFVLLLQLDLLTIKSPVVKVISWTLALAFWVLTFLKRKKYFTLF